MVNTILVASAALLAGLLPSHAAPTRVVGGDHATARSAPNLRAVSVTWAPIVSGLDAPVQVVSARDGSARLFVVQKGGLVRVVRNGEVAARPYLDLAAQVSGGGERGLLSMAFHPRFAQRPFVYVLYTRLDGDVVLARMRADSAGAGRVLAGTRRVLLTIEHSTNTNHNGGQLAFGPDGMLYVSVGDGGGQGDPANNAQNRTRLLGKVLRLDVDCAKRYCIPPDNPFAGARPGRGEIWLLGLRNPWRMSFDGQTERLWIGDVGGGGFEEVNRIAPDPLRRNLGWSCREGFVVLTSSRCRDGVDYQAPLTVVAHDAGLSITGGYVYRGRRFADLIGGAYVFGDFVNGKVWLFSTRQGKVLQAARLGPGEYNGPTSFGLDDRREIVAVTYDGTLWRMRVRSV